MERAKNLINNLKPKKNKIIKMIKKRKKHIKTKFQVSYLLIVTIQMNIITQKIAMMIPTKVITNRL